MREHKFKGKRLNSDEWIYGDLNHIGEGVYIFNESHGWKDPSWHEVDPETVMEKTSSRDIYNNDIYEGDLVSKNDKNYYVKWINNAFMLQHVHKKEVIPLTDNVRLVVSPESDYKKVANIVCKRFDISINELENGSKKRNISDANKIIAKYLSTKYFRKDIAEFTNRPISTITARVIEHDTLCMSNKKFKEISSLILKEINYGY